MKKSQFYTALMLLVVLLPLAVSAQTQVPFKLGELNKFLADFPDVMAYMTEKGEAIENSAQPDTWKGSRMGNLFKDYVEKRGWRVERFSYIASHLAKGLVAAEVNQQAPEMQAQMAQAMAAIQSNPSLSAEMKQQMMAQMSQGMAETGKLKDAGKDIPASEMALIAANRDRIRAAFESP